MKKKYVSWMLVLAMLFAFVPSALAEQREYVENNQKNFDPYALTTLVECYKYVNTNYVEGAGDNFNHNGIRFGNTHGGGEYIVFQNMDFGESVPTTVDVAYGVDGDFGGKMEFRKGSPGGELIAVATSENTGEWETPTEKTFTVTNPSAAQGVFDLYVVFTTTTFGNVWSFQFNKLKTAYEGTNALDAIETTGFDMDAIIGQSAPGLVTFDAYANPDETLSATYQLSFEAGGADKLIFDAMVMTPGTISIYQDSPNGKLLQQIQIEETTGDQFEEFTYTASADMHELASVNQICFVFEPGLEIVFQDFYFTQTFDPFFGDDEVNIVYMGGSITAGAMASSSDKCWVSLVGENMKTMFEKDGRTVNNYNVGIGGTGSDLGLMRLQEDVIAKDPDMVFLEFAVNDAGRAEGLYQMESIIRTLNELPDPPYVMFIYTTNGNLNTDSSYHQQVANHYGIPAVDLQQIIKNDSSVNINDLLADGVHPNDTGYAYYAAAINAVLSKNAGYVHPLKPQYSLSELSKIVNISKADNAGFTVSGTQGVDYEYNNGILYLNTPGTTVTFNISGDLLGLRDYIYDHGGMYSVAVNGRTLFTRDTCYGTTGETLNMGYLNMDLGWRDSHTVTVTMLEGKNNNVVEPARVALGYAYYNTNQSVTQIYTRSPYERIEAVSADVLSSGLTTNGGNYIGGSMGGRYMVFKNVNFSKSFKEVQVEYATDGQATDREGFLQFRIGGTSGQIIAEFQGSENTGGWESFETFTQSAIKSVYGTYDLYVTFTKPFANIKSFQFVPMDESIDAKTVLNPANYTEKTEGVEIIHDAFDYFQTGDYIKYSVDFADGHTFNSLGATVAGDQIPGKIIVRDAAVDGPVIAQIDVSELSSWSQYHEMASLLTETGKALTGVHTLYVTFEGEKGFCSLKGIYFENTRNVDELLFNTQTYSAGSETDRWNSSNGMFEGFNMQGAWARWDLIDFGTETTNRTVTFQAGVGLPFRNALIRLRLDSETGPIIAEATLKDAPGMDWTVPVTLTAPVIAEVVGLHSIYLTVENGPYMEGDHKAGNIWEFSFAPQDEKIMVNSEILGYTGNPQELSTTVTFIKDAELTAARVMVATAAYDQTGKLIGIDMQTVKPTDGVNAVKCSIPYDAVKDQDYMLRAYIWDADTYAPLTEAKLLEPTI